MIRVELHNAEPDDYDTLHNAMADQEFYRFIQDDNTQKWYKLPRAQYYYNGNIEDRNVILNSVVAAVKETYEDFEAIVTKSNGSIWTGLEELRS